MAIRVCPRVLCMQIMDHVYSSFRVCVFNFSARFDSLLTLIVATSSYTMDRPNISLQNIRFFFWISHTWSEPFKDILRLQISVGWKRHFCQLIAVFQVLNLTVFSVHLKVRYVFALQLAPLDYHWVTPETCRCWRIQTRAWSHWGSVCRLSDHWLLWPVQGPVGAVGLIL